MYKWAGHIVALGWRHRLGLITMLLGLNSFSPWTPRGLQPYQYKRLLRCSLTARLLGIVSRHLFRARLYSHPCSKYTLGPTAKQAASTQRRAIRYRSIIPTISVLLTYDVHPLHLPIIDQPRNRPISRSIFLYLRPAAYNAISHDRRMLITSGQVLHTSHTLIIGCMQEAVLSCVQTCFFLLLLLKWDVEIV